MSDFDSADEYFVDGKVFVVVGCGGYGYATAGAESFDFGTKGEFSEVINGEETGNHVFTEEGRSGGKNTGTDGGIGRSKDSVRTGPSCGGGGVNGERRSCGG